MYFLLCAHLWYFKGSMLLSYVRVGHLVDSFRLREGEEVARARGLAQDATWGTDRILLRAGCWTKHLPCR